MQWTGQYEFLAEMEARLRYVIPLTLVLVVVFYLSMQVKPQMFLVLSSLPFAVAGSVWLAFMNYNLSTAVWVGLIAVAGVAAETGIVMVSTRPGVRTGTCAKAAFIHQRDRTRRWSKAPPLAFAR